ncbi:MAG: hypothetical protein M3Y54_03050 [Bacteroidota bacterium]|nr:hypothetical protein [Bacteroidota bacterium]
MPALLVLGCMGSTTKTAENIKIYEGIVFGSREITGSDKFAEPGDKFLTNIPTELDAISIDALFSRVGSFRRDAGIIAPLPLFNMSDRAASYPLLDKIDFDYYEDISFRKIQKEKDFVKLYKTAFDRFLNGYRKAPTPASKKDTLNNYPIIKSYLVRDRLSVRQDTIEFNQSRKTQITAKLKAELSGIRLASGAELSPAIRAYLSSLVDQVFTVKGCYYAIRLDEQYVGKIVYHVQNTRQQDLPADEFSQNLIDCIKRDNSAINSQVVAFELKGYYNKSKITATQLGADLTARFQSQLKPEQVAKLAVDISSSFERKTDRTLKVAFNHVYFIRYGTGDYVDGLSFKQ